MHSKPTVVPTGIVSTLKQESNGAVVLGLAPRLGRLALCLTAA
jgi:hypothetical protein